MNDAGSSSRNTLVVEGWRFIPQSYAIVNQWLLLALSRRSDIDLRVRDVPYVKAHWNRGSGFFDPAQEATISALPLAEADTIPDATLRMATPYDFVPAEHGRTAVFATAEFRVVPANYFSGSIDIARLNQNRDFMVIAPSRWSAEGFLRLGLRSDQVALIPIGVDTTIYKPDAESRERNRQELGLQGFVFLSIGAMTGNKGIDVLLRAFARVVQKHRDAVLVLKGTDALYGSEAMLEQCFRSVPSEDQNLIAGRVKYLGDMFSMQQMAMLYRVADAYVTPYRGEGFNMPVLEAAASGVPVICTAGGSTDDFVDDSFALKIRSRLTSISIGDKVGDCLEPDVDHLTDLMCDVIDRSEWRRSAAAAGPRHAAARYNWNLVSQLLVDTLFGDTRRSPAPSQPFLTA